MIAGVKTKPKKKKKGFLLLPLGFSARSWSAASEGSSAAAPACGSPAGRSLSRAPGPQLAPEQRSRRDREKKEFLCIVEHGCGHTNKNSCTGSYLVTDFCSEGRFNAQETNITVNKPFQGT